MRNLQEVKRRKSEIELGSEGKQSGILSNILRFGGGKSGVRTSKVSMNHDTAQDDDAGPNMNEIAGPNMNEIMPTAYTSSMLMRYSDQDDAKVQEVEDLY
jgi:hypothetical protein